MFLAIPLMLRNGVNFWLALLLGCCLTMLLYALTVSLLGRFGVQL